MVLLLYFLNLNYLLYFGHLFSIRVLGLLAIKVGIGEDILHYFIITN